MNLEEPNMEFRLKPVNQTETSETLNQRRQSPPSHQGRKGSKSKLPGAFRFSAGIFLIAAVCDPLATPATITDLGLGAAYDINASGQIVGESGTTRHAFLYSVGTMNDLGTLGSLSSASSAVGINAAGQIVGFSYVTADNSGDSPAISYTVWGCG